MCFAFFANVSVLFSIWFFYLIASLEVGVLNQLGLTSSGSGGVASGAGGAAGAVSAAFSA